MLSCKFSLVCRKSVKRSDTSVFIYILVNLEKLLYEALKIGLFDVIKLRIKRRDAPRSGKGNQPLNIKIAVERPNFKARITKF